MEEAWGEIVAQRPRGGGYVKGVLAVACCAAVVVSGARWSGPSGTALLLEAEVFLKKPVSATTESNNRHAAIKASQHVEHVSEKKHASDNAKHAASAKAEEKKKTNLDKAKTKKDKKEEDDERKATLQKEKDDKKKSQIVMETERTAQEDQHAAVKGGQQENNETREETVNSNVGDCVSPESGPVLRGVDVVAYRSLDSGANATLGDPQWQSMYGKYAFYFASEANRNVFQTDPARYAPRFGGFCAYGIADESFWTKSTLGPEANPDIWRVVDDALLVFMYCTPEAKFMLSNSSAQLDRAEKIWSTWFDGEPVFNTNCFWDDRLSGGTNADREDEASYDCLE